MNWEEIVGEKKGLPNDLILKRLYSLSREIKGTEKNSTKSSIETSGGERKANYFSNQFFMNGFGQISFITPGCKIGQCCFCSYGASDVKLTPKIVASEMDKFKDAILQRQKSGENIYAILLDSVGSILDSNEFSPECLDVVFVKLEELLAEAKSIESVSFETHYQTLGSYDENGKYVASNAIEKLIEFKRNHPEISTFVIELGFETANGEIRDNLLFKHIDDETYKKSVKLLQDNGIDVEVNVMATLPFLSQSEQIEESAKSIILALSAQSEGGYGANSVTLFPLNVRKHTFCDYVFDVQEKYNKKHNTTSPDFMKRTFPIWSMVATLAMLIESGHEEMLDRVSVAWFGGRELAADGSDIFPDGWEETYDDFVKYRMNLSGEDSRVNIIKRLMKNPHYLQFLQAVRAERQNEPSYHDRAKYIHDLIESMDMPYLSQKPNCKNLGNN